MRCRTLLAALTGVIAIDAWYVEYGYNPLNSSSLATVFICAYMVVAALIVTLALVALKHRTAMR